MDDAMTLATARHAIGVDIDRPFQRVLAAWLRMRAYHLRCIPLSAARSLGESVDLIVCEIADPKGSGRDALRDLGVAHPGAPMIAISSRFVAGSRADTLARQLGVGAALAKPFSRDDLYAALDALATAHAHAHPSL